MRKSKIYRTESEVMSAVRKRLIAYESTRIVEWSARLNSGMVRKGYHFIKLQPTGTPDYVAVLRNKINELTLLFIECKKPGCNIVKGSPQDKFFSKYFSIKDVICIMVDHPKVLDFYINKLGIERIKELPDEL